MIYTKVETVPKTPNFILTTSVVKEGKVYVIFVHLRFKDVPGIIYETTANPADGFTRHLLRLFTERKMALAIFFDRAGMPRKAIGMNVSAHANSIEKVLKTTKENEWTKEEFLRAREKIFKKFSPEDFIRISSQLSAQRN